MAETTGVTSTESRSEKRESPKGEGTQTQKKKRNRTLAIVGGAGVLLLFMSHKGGQSSSSQTAKDAENQALTDELSALESGQLSPGGSGFDAAGSGGGGSGSDPSQVGTGGDNTTAPSDQLTPGPTDSTSNATEPSSTTHKPRETTAEFNRNFNKKWLAKRAEKKKSQEKKKAANPHSNHSGGQGVTVHGRTFPGAKSYHVGAGQRVGVDVHNRVTVNYGGHSDTHTSVNHGRKWHDHADGPPTRRSDHRRRR